MYSFAIFLYYLALNHPDAPFPADASIDDQNEWVDSHCGVTAQRPTDHVGYGINQNTGRWDSHIIYTQPQYRCSDGRSHQWQTAPARR